MMEGILETLDEYYSANLAQDIVRGMREASARGYWVSSQTPFGFRRVRVQDGSQERIKLEIASTSATIVSRMF